MLLRKTRNPLVYMQFGNAFLIAGVLSIWKFHPATLFWQGFADGFTGAMFGAAIAMHGLSIYLRSKRDAGTGACA